ncbi:MAG: hypothetical protein LIO46_03470 [Clostridiales bacterium]|nr:hypothetical protein [Clostridiales bacterium]
MKRLIVSVLAVMFLFAGCAGSGGTVTNVRWEPVTDANGEPMTDANGEPVTETIEETVLEITEKMFIGQINDIWYNAEDYLGKTIKYEGIFETYYYEATDRDYHYVLRYGPGCCGDDGNVGFEVQWDGELPSVFDWVEVIGVVEEYTDDDGYTTLRVNASSMTVKNDERGAETVSQ